MTSGSMITVAPLCSLWIPEEHIGDRFCGLAFLVAGEVSVDVLGDRDGSVAEHLGHDPQRGALGEHD